MLDMSSGEVLEHSRDIITDYDLLPFMDSSYSMWQRFLDEVMPDKDEQSCLQEFLDCAFLTGADTPWRSLRCSRGSGSNGKSVVFDV